MNSSFFTWLDILLQGAISEEIVAFNFNLYESNNSQQFDIQLVGSKTYSSYNDDWACNNDYSSGENLFAFYSPDWVSCLSAFADLIISYMRTGNNRQVLLSRKAVTFGFVDGDLFTVCENGVLTAPDSTFGPRDF